MGMGVITIGEGGTVRIPEELLERARLKAGAHVSLRVSDEGDIVIQPEERDPDQAWFWTEEWQKKEREADEDIAAGRTTRYLSDEAFTAELERRAQQP
jgi:antitoxin component of MazEF toxin-antitoxin module